MDLKREDIINISSFFLYDNIELSKYFIYLYNYAQTNFGMIFYVDKDIIGFKRKNGLVFAYVKRINIGGDYIFYIYHNNEHTTFVRGNFTEINKMLFGVAQLTPIQHNTANSESENLDVSKDLLNDEDYDQSALEEEQDNAKSNYALLDSTIKSIENVLPYKDVTPYSVAHDYNDIANLQSEKKVNQPYWDAINYFKKYFDEPSLYQGHICVDNREYYLMENNLPTYESQKVSTKSFPESSQFPKLISTDDAARQDIFDAWRMPSKNKKILFSRNITMQDKQVTAVDIIYDSRNELYSTITDLYLRNALKRNKNKTNIQSIIQTIQEKQNQIRVYDKDKSFIVQGCAGSGKTMVLLHRLRYLLFNKYINSSSYALLLPSDNLKDFIAKNAFNFNINASNIYSYTDYYRHLLNQENEEIKEIDELIFPKEYLVEVYSQNFIKELYKALLDQVTQKTNSLIDRCDQSLTSAFEREKKALLDSYNKTYKDCVKSINKLLAPFKDYISIDDIDTPSAVETIINELNAVLEKAVAEIAECQSQSNDFVLDEETINKYVSENELLLNLNNEILIEEKRVKKASIFTRGAHQQKLRTLKGKYEKELAAFKEEIFIKEREKREKSLYKEKADKGVKLKQSLEPAIAEINSLKNDLALAYNQITTIDESFDHQFAVKNEEVISALQEAITYTGEVTFSSLKENFCPLTQEIFSYIGKFKKLYNCYKSLKKSANAANQFKLFQQNSEKDLGIYLYKLLLIRCKKILKEKFGYIPSKQYKHYWYLSLYFKYLTDGEIQPSRQHLFIDETQDLSLSELTLLHNLNSSAVLNLFGDTNQLINTFGINDWNEIPFIKTVRKLEENFRNTNQIVDYCNKCLSFKMTPVGVDMEEVAEYYDFEELKEHLTDTSAEYVFIVKDEYKRQDLIALLGGDLLENSRIYTVKEVKGLEFKEVYVFDTGMTDNEKYISYTRSLIKLNVIKTLPESADRREIVVYQDEETEVTEGIDEAEDELSPTKENLEGSTSIE